MEEYTHVYSRILKKLRKLIYILMSQNKRVGRWSRQKGSNKSFSLKTPMNFMPYVTYSRIVTQLCVSILMCSFYNTELFELASNLIQSQFFPDYNTPHPMPSGLLTLISPDIKCHCSKYDWLLTLLLWIYAISI